MRDVARRELASRRRLPPWARGALARLVLFAALLPLALSSAMPVFARTIAGPAPHVCRCEARGGHAACACPICHPNRAELRGRYRSFRGPCGDEDPVFGAAHGASLPPPPALQIEEAPPRGAVAARRSAAPPGIVASPPKEPPKLATS